jgi:FkbM family methyltransferase
MALWRVERCCEHSFLGNALAPGTVVIDLGVNTGEFANWITDHFGCSVYGAEPDFELLSDLVQRKNLTVIPCALGGQNELGILRRRAGKCPTLFAAGFPADSELNVDVLTLEEFLWRTGLPENEPIGLVKVDIEGGEVSMFEEAPDALLGRVAQFTVEFHDFIWPELSLRVKRIKSRLRSLGFRVINFSLDNTDVLFLNEKLLGLGPAGDAYLRTVKYITGIRRRAGHLVPSAWGWS